ncbi:MAG: HpcH/HpaI aldolase/citrate lyase family protein [Candidatus Marinimicrobia bacterium]|nr:HpcH/HpaI aldolase/citrate lyase family protein [Candidatus Neomarinimicrobiota bacterium]
MSDFFSSGNAGPSARGDCFVTLTLKESGGITLDIRSKVRDLFGKSIRDLCLEMMEYYGIPDAHLSIEDQGALPFTLRARLEAVVRKAFPDSKPFNITDHSGAYSPSEKDCFRRSRLYLPGNSPKLMINAGLYAADGVILDLEDSVAPARKDEARILVRHALHELDFGKAERMVRINPFPAGIQDLEMLIPEKVNCVLIPKCERREDVIRTDLKIKEICSESGFEYPVYLMPILESARGILAAKEIAEACDTVVALAIGLEDLTADLGTRRTNQGNESYVARSLLVLAARAAGVQAIDSVFSDISDMDALMKTALESKKMGFDGMGCIHPRQIPVIHDAFAPSSSETEKAQAIVMAYEEAEKKGLGVISLGSKMIDAPVLKRAQKTIQLAETLNRIPKNWRETYGK